MKTTVAEQDTLHDFWQLPQQVYKINNYCLVFCSAVTAILFQCHLFGTFNNVVFL